LSSTIADAGEWGEHPGSIRRHFQAYFRLGGDTVSIK
jgi:hypothetical protein